MSVLDTVREERYINPLLSMFALMALVVIITAISLLIFWNSDTRQTVVSIQQRSQSQANGDLQPSASSIDDDGILEVSELLLIQEGIQNERQKLNPSTDFDGSLLEEETIGL